MVQDLIKKANEETMKRILSAQPTLVGIGVAGDVIPGMTSKTILHAGPPITWENMSGPLKGAVIGGLIYEGLAENEVDAIALVESGEIQFDPCHHHNAVGPMAGVVTASMPVFIVENKTFGNYAFCTLNEGLGKVLRYGAYSEDVIKRLKWMETILAPVLKEAIGLAGPINLKSMIAQVIMMGDEGHNRNKAGTSLLIRELAAHIINTSFSNQEKIEVLNFMNSNDHFFLNLTMPACKSSLDPAMGIKYSTIVCAMSRNGTEFGIRVSGLGDRWFTAPAEIVDGLLFPGFTAEDANPDIGDSVITETTGIGGFAMAAAQAIVQFVGGNPQDAINYSKLMYEITEAENNTYKIPVLNFKGTATGINIMKVVETGILPIINTGIAHKEPGVGQVGAGLVRPPMKCFEDALEAFVDALTEEGLVE
ncbi:YlbE family protein [Alkaliphilus peptidifermentans]|uniref:DUF1116 domain-containing protein n=1 Tax=Alkaliphilus peptidifermentans DSM 18978 TaxID=1120976 RepID=A0A1G5ICG9_9FIRM|nr:DUF1116 domain-containing protein [Alkaliphilus peptidifermentans]SCY73380.1 Protein of unknown function [Alkaliphilus peptidifermentans DSM 18978]